MKFSPFRLKVALLSALISGAVLAGFGAASWYLLYRQNIAAVDTEIRSLGSRHPGWLANRGNFERFNTSLEFIFGEENRGRVILLIREAAGKALYTSPGWPTNLAPESIELALEDDPSAPAARASLTNAAAHGGMMSGQGGGGRGWGGQGRGMGLGYGPGAGRGASQVVFDKIPRFFSAQAGGSSWRLGVLGNDDLRLVVGLNCDALRAELNRMRNTFLLTLPLALLLVGGGGWLVAGRALRPITSIAGAAEKVTAQGLDQRIPASNEDPEITRLIQVLNGMMNRLEASFRQATRFSADASHELKTPLAVMQGELENAIQAAAPGCPEQAVYTSLLEQTQRLKTITRSLLLLAQADAGQLKLTLEEMDLSACLHGLVEDAHILAGDSNLRFELKIQPGLRIRADSGLLQMALRNLVNNAVNYNETGGLVGVALSKNDGTVTLTLTNTGPGIAPADQARIFDRFYRADKARGQQVPGLGLGLSLAREIIHAHRGELVLKESRPGHTSFEVTLERMANPTFPAAH